MRATQAHRHDLARFFLGSHAVGLLALAALLLNVTNDAFGYVAIQNDIEEEVLIVNHYKEKMLAAPRTLPSEDDQKLADNIASRPTAIGFFGYSFYKDNADSLTLLSVDGVQPDEATVESAEYLLSRPLYLYTTQIHHAGKAAVLQRSCRTTSTTSTSRLARSAISRSARMR